MDLHVELPGLHLRNPVIPTSGCFDFGREFTELYDLSLLGGITAKSATPCNRFGDPTPCAAETPRGMPNAIDLQDPGVGVIMERKPSWLAQFGTEIVASVAGAGEEEYVEVVTKLNKSEIIKAYKLNIGCSDVKHGRIGLGTDPKLATSVTRMVKETAEKPVHVKLSPNVTNIVKIAKAVEGIGIDGLVLINTLMGMRMDPHTEKPLPTNMTGGLSGPVIKSVAVRMVHQVASAVSIPTIGAGDITRAEDVPEFLYAGTGAVGMGTQNSINPLYYVKIIEDLPEVLKKHGNNSPNDAVGRSFR